MDWTPTAKLRFVNRKVLATLSGTATHNIKVLQQWWENGALKAVGSVGEWRDVPLEME